MDLGGLLVEDAFDTTVRLGDCGTQTISGDLQTTQEDKIGDMTVDLAIGHGFYVHFSDDWNCTYIDITDSEGRDTGYVLYEKDLEEISKEVPGDAKVHCIIGKGMGNQYYAHTDLSYTGFWNQDVYEVEHGFKDASGILKSHSEDKYDSLQTDYQWKVSLRQKAGKKVMLQAGDFLTLAPNHEPEEYLSCQTITQSTGGKLEIELGARRPRYIDAWEVLQGLDRSFTDSYLQEAHEAITQSTTFYPSDPAHSATAGTLTFAVPDGVLNSDIRPRVTLSLSLRAQTTTSLKFGRVAVKVSVDGVWLHTGMISATTIGGEDIPEMDLTDYLTAGADNAVTIDVMMVNEVTDTHVASTGHPQISASGTMNFYKRGEMT
jgi:hypothetical protein